jgi:hypothetical protein
MNNLFSKKSEKVWATISIIWLAFIVLVASGGYYSFQWDIFFAAGILPVVVGWGIYLVWKK